MFSVVETRRFLVPLVQQLGLAGHPGHRPLRHKPVCMSTYARRDLERLADADAVFGCWCWNLWDWIWLDLLWFDLLYVHNVYKYIYICTQHNIYSIITHAFDSIANPTSSSDQASVLLPMAGYAWWAGCCQRPGLERATRAQPNVRLLWIEIALCSVWPHDFEGNLTGFQSLRFPKASLRHLPAQGAMWC